LSIDELLYAVSVTGFIISLL